MEFATNMSSTLYETEQQDDFAHRPDSAVDRNGASGPEPGAEFYGYPFICGYSMWTDGETRERP